MEHTMLLTDLAQAYVTWINGLPFDSGTKAFLAGLGWPLVPLAPIMGLALVMGWINRRIGR
jgi:hypothetical protein